MNRYMILFIVLAGCTDVNNYELNNAEAICKDHGGIDYITATILHSEAHVTCGDGFRQSTVKAE